MAYRISISEPSVKWILVWRENILYVSQARDFENLHKRYQ